MFFEQVNRFGEKTALLYKPADRYVPISWIEFGKAVREVAGGLIHLGVKPGDRVAIMVYNRPEWAIADLAILAAGAITVPIYHTSTPAKTEFILKKTGTKIAFIARSEKAEMLAGCDASVDKIISLDPVGIGSPGSCSLDFQTLRDFGAEGLKKQLGQELEKRIQQSKPEDCATIIFTSGTTGDPKGVMLSHANILANAAACQAAEPVGPEDLCLSFLPLSHSLERTVGQFLMLMAGVTVAYATSMRDVPKNLQEVRPTVALAVPRFYEKMYAKVLGAMRNAPAPKRALFQWAMHMGRRRMLIEAAGKRPGFWFGALLWLADHFAYAKLKKRLGGRIRFFVSGGAPLAAEIVEFFLAAGVEILEGYGLTECSPVISVNRIGRVRSGTVGPPLPGMEVRIAEDGEVLAKGSSVMLGYYQDEEATSQVIRDGWLYTGDIGELDDGYLRITDRKKHIIVTSGGKNIAPQQVENLILSDEYIQQVMIYGDRKKYLTALVVPDYKRIKDAAAVPGLDGFSPEQLAVRQEFHDFLMSRIAEKSVDLAHYEQIKKVLVLAEPLSEDKGELTPTMKVKRKLVTGKFQAQLDALYETEG